ncbi:MAG: BPL-N domain-containing protein [Chlamydiota bacterium]
MTLSIKKMLNPIHQVIIYKGHEKNRLLGPYPENIIKRIDMFKGLNRYRKEIHRPEWKVTVAAGEELVDVLKDNDPKKTLLVIPAGQSSHLDKVFSLAENSFIKDEFFKQGGRGYFNCGSAYWISEKRIYHDLCTEAKEEKKTIVKVSNLPLFKGVSEGPLCPYPGKKYKVGFFSDAVTVTDGKTPCTIYLSGGGSFFPDESAQKVKVLVKYLPKELERLGKPLPECTKWEKAAMMVSVEKGAALISMFHPYYGPNDFDVEMYEKAFPECGTDWKAVKERLSPLDIRMRFVLNSMLAPLEDLDWSP